MIIVERRYEVARPEGGGYKTVVGRGIFSDDDIIGLDEFLNEHSETPGYEWRNVEYKYTKL